MYSPLLEASYDRQMTTSWQAASTLVARLLAQAGPEALEGDARIAFARRVLPILSPLMEDSLRRSRVHATTQAGGRSGAGAGPLDLSDLSFGEGDAYALIASAARYFYATGNKKDFSDPAIRSAAFSYAATLTAKAVVTVLAERSAEATARTYESRGIKFFERYLRAGDHCDLCKSVAGTRVTRKDIKPLHDNCTCGVRPLKR